MGKDRSLDEFLGGDSTADESADDLTAAESPEEADDASPEAGEDEQDGVLEDVDTDSEPAVEPAQATYDWSPDGNPCASCDALVNRRWFDGGAFVCHECKDW